MGSNARLETLPPIATLSDIIQELFWLRYRHVQHMYRATPHEPAVLLHNTRGCMLSTSVLGIGGDDGGPHAIPTGSGQCL